VGHGAAIAMAGSLGSRMPAQLSPLASAPHVALGSLVAHSPPSQHAVQRHGLTVGQGQLAVALGVQTRLQPVPHSTVGYLHVPAWITSLDERRLARRPCGSSTGGAAVVMPPPQDQHADGGRAEGDRSCSDCNEESRITLEAKAPETPTPLPARLVLLPSRW
jgi:hypothetical protein